MSAAKIDVSGKLDTIKQQMPTVYGMIARRAKELGNQVFADVRAGLRGEADKFYAFEGAYVVGTRFTDPNAHDLAFEAVIACGVRAGAWFFEPPAQTPVRALVQAHASDKGAS